MAYMYASRRGRLAAAAHTPTYAGVPGRSSTYANVGYANTGAPGLSSACANAEASGLGMKSDLDGDEAIEF